MMFPEFVYTGARIMGVIGTLILTTALAGVAGTGLGGLIGAMLQKDSSGR